jgi:pimeloyl-ACP methyl ester carboxylesterase
MVDHRGRFVLVLVLAVFAVALSFASAASAACPAVKLIGVRGSGEKKSDGHGYGTTVDAVRRWLSSHGIPAEYVNYQALKVEWWNPAYYTDRYNRSIDTGINALTAHVGGFLHTCHQSDVVLAGFSQGAQVVADTYQRYLSGAEQARVAGIALFGDPRFKGGQPGPVNVGSFKRRFNGIVAQVYHRRVWAAADYDKVKSYCVNHDPVCNFSSLGSAISCGLHNDCAHLHYMDLDLPKSRTSYTTAAAEFLLGRAEAAIGHTTITRQSPVTAAAAIAPAFSVTTTFPSGTCEEGSEVGQAYRCFADHYVLDPCYAVAEPVTGDGTGVVCPDSPFSTELTAITTATGMGFLAPDSYDEPDGIMLGSGTQCIEAQGAHSADTAGRVVDYYCTDKNTVVLRGLHETRSVWTADVARPGPNYSYIAVGSDLIVSAVRLEHQVPPANRPVTDAGDATVDELDSLAREHHEVDCGQQQTVANSSRQEKIFDSETPCYQASLIVTEWDNGDALEPGWSCSYDDNATLLCELADSVDTSNPPAFFASTHIRAISSG